MIAINAATSNTTTMTKDLNCKLIIKLNKHLPGFLAFTGSASLMRQASG
jgi:hypothetical protein